MDKIKQKLNTAYAWVKSKILWILVAVGIIGIALASTDQPIVYDASLYRGGSILLVKTIATGEGNGRYEAGDIVEIRDGEELYQKFGSGDFLGREEKRKLLPIYLPVKLNEAQKKLLTATSSSIMNGRRERGIDFTQILSTNDILTVRSEKDINKIPEASLLDIKVKPMRVKSVVQIPKYILAMEGARDTATNLFTPVYAGTGTSTKTINTDNAGTPDYTSLNAWEGAEQADLTDVGTGQNAVASITGGSAVDTTAVTIDGWTTDATHIITIETTTAGRHDGKWNTSKYRLEASNYFGALFIVEENIRVEGLQIMETSTSGGGGASQGGIYGSNGFSTGGNFYFYDNIITRSGTYTDTNNHGIHIESGSGTDWNYSIRNNIIYNFNSAIWLNNDNNDNLSIYNNDVIDCVTEGFIIVQYGSNDILNFKNNLAFNCVDDYDFVSTSATSNITNNAYSEGADPGTSGVDISGTASTTLFIDPANADFHINSGVALIDAGTDLSSIFTTDIDGDTRSGTWDIGADEFVSAVTEAIGGIPNIFIVGKGFIRGNAYVR